MRSIIRSLSATMVLLLLSAPCAWSDVTLKEKVVFDGFGGRGWGANETENTTRIAGDRLQQETTSKSTGKVMKKFRKEGDTTGSIIRLDRKMMYAVDYGEKKYTEMSFEQLRQTSEDALARLSAGPEVPEGQSEQAGLECEGLDLKVNSPGNKVDVNGFQAKRTNITGKQTCTSTEGGETCTLGYKVAVWTSDNMPGQDETMAFMKKQAEAMGFDIKKLVAKGKAAGAMFMANTSGLEKAMEEMGKIEGYPVRTKMEIFSEGACAMAMPEVEMPSMKEAMKEKFKGAGKFFSRKKKEEEKAEKPEDPGRTKLFGMTSDVLSVSTEKVPASHFEIPEGFKKQTWDAPGK